MKKILALLLASAMLVSATALIIGAEVDEETTAVEETTEDTTAVEETTTELGDVTAEETTGEPVDPPAQPAKPIAPTLLNEFTATGLVQNQNSPNTKGTLNNGVIEFANNGVVFGSWDGDNFYTGNLVVRVNERAQFGSFAFVPRSDKSLMFLKVGD